MPFTRVPESSSEKALSFLRPQDFLASSTVQKAKSLVRKGGSGLGAPHRAYVRKMLAKRMERCDDAGVP